MHLAAEEVLPFYFTSQCCVVLQKSVISILILSLIILERNLMEV